MRHDYTAQNAGQGTITALWLWIEDGHGKTVSSVGGSNRVLNKEDKTKIDVEVPRPLPAEQTLMVKWKDADGEHTESTGIRPRPHA